MKHEKKLLRKIVTLALVFAICLPIGANAHSGRTDSAGGHHDYKNVSGLGYYHYHHGYPAHLHNAGVCPYNNSDNATSSTATNSESSKTTSKNAESTKPVRISRKTLKLVIGQTKKLKVTGTKSKIKWSSNKPRIASVNKYGKVKAKTKGKAIIKAKIGSRILKCKVRVVKK